jgi:hypothetical protein
MYDSPYHWKCTEPTLAVFGLPVARLKLSIPILLGRWLHLRMNLVVLELIDIEFRSNSKIAATSGSFGQSR